MEIQEREAKAVSFSSDYDDIKLFRAATRFLKNTPGWFLLGLNYGSDDCGSHLTLFLEQMAIGAKPIKSINEATPEEIAKAKEAWKQSIKEEAAKKLGGTPDDYIIH